jgi:hypothetical protein
VWGFTFPLKNSKKRKKPERGASCEVPFAAFTAERQKHLYFWVLEPNLELSPEIPQQSLRAVSRPIAVYAA